MSLQAITTPHVPPGKPTRNWRQLVTLNSRFIPPLFITLILLVGNLSFGILESYTRTLLAISTSIGVELLLGKLLFHKWPHLASAYITGISVGILLRSPAYWPYALCAAIAITSKYVIRVRNRHIWNPSNFGICILLFLASESVASLSIQWGNNLAAMTVIWILGSVIVWRVKRFRICATYVISFALFAALRSWIVGDPWQSELSPITGPEYQLFIFFMITDPKTTVRSWKGQCVVAFLVAAVEMLLRLDQSIYAPLYALFLVGPSAMLIDIWHDAHRTQSEGSMTKPVLAG